MKTKCLLLLAAAVTLAGCENAKWTVGGGYNPQTGSVNVSVGKEPVGK